MSSFDPSARVNEAVLNNISPSGSAWGKGIDIPPVKPVSIIASKIRGAVGRPPIPYSSSLIYCDKIYQEKKKRRVGQAAETPSLLEYIREGDTRVVTRLDRLARSTLHLCQIAADLERKQVNLQVLDQNINTNDATGRLLFNMFGAIAQFETEIRAERQMDGIQKG